MFKETTREDPFRGSTEECSQLNNDPGKRSIRGMWCVCVCVCVGGGGEGGGYEG